MLFKSLFLGIAALVFIFTGITDVVFRISEMAMYNLLDDSGADTAIALTKLVRSLGWVKIGVGFSLIGLTDADEGLKYILNKTPAKKLVQKIEKKVS